MQMMIDIWEKYIRLPSAEKLEEPVELVEDWDAWFRSDRIN